jgi:hypothetical protein
MRRWVRYQAPLMVCVELDDEDGDRVVTVVLGEEDEDLELMRGADGAPMVYDENMQLLEAGPDADRATREAEDRQWPEPVAWENGPDALRYPGLYDPDPEDDADDSAWPDLTAEHGNASSA